jgi:hypothetical protein
MIAMRQWSGPAHLFVLVIMTAAACGLVAPIEPLPDADAGAGAGAGAGASAGSGGGGNAGLGGAGSSAGGGGKGGNGGDVAGRGGKAGSGSGQSGAATAGAGAFSGGGQSGFGGAEAGGGNGGSDDDQCEPEIEADIKETEDPSVPLPVNVGLAELGIQAREDPVLVPLDASHYRAFALNVRNEFVYADLPISREDAGAPEWKRVGWSGDYFFSPPAVAAPPITPPATAPERMWVFGVGAHPRLQVRVQEAPFDGPWTELLHNDVELSNDGVSASANTFGNVLVAGRCLDGRACVGVQPIAAMDRFDRLTFLRLPVESSYRPAIVQSIHGVHVAVTGKDGIIRHALGTAGSDSRWTEEDFVSTDLAGVCFDSPPSLVSGPTSVDVFARGTDGSLYWQAIGLSGGWTRLSTTVASSSLALNEGVGTLVFALTDGRHPMLRRRLGERWSRWDVFNTTAVASSPERPFPGAALALGRAEVRLVMRGTASYLVEYSFVQE